MLTVFYRNLACQRVSDRAVLSLTPTHNGRITRESGQSRNGVDGHRIHDAVLFTRLFLPVHKNHQLLVLVVIPRSHLCSLSCHAGAGGVPPCSFGPRLLAGFICPWCSMLRIPRGATKCGQFFFVTEPENLSIIKRGPENEGRGANETQEEAFTSSAETRAGRARRNQGGHRGLSARRHRTD